MSNEEQKKRRLGLTIGYLRMFSKSRDEKSKSQSRGRLKEARG